MKGLNVGTLIGGIIGLVVLMTAGAALYPTLHTAGATLNTSVGGGMGELLAGALLGIIVVAGIIFAVLKVFHVI